MDWMTYVGFAAALMTTVSHLPQVIKSWKTKKTHDISIVMYLVLVTGIFTWTVYGILLGDWPLILANAVTFALTFSILILKIRYG